MDHQTALLIAWSMGTAAASYGLLAAYLISLGQTWRSSKRARAMLAASLDRLAGIATHVLHLAPPPAVGEGDPRTAALLRALARRRAPLALVYGSTSGVYGDCGGARINETRAVAAHTVDADAPIDRLVAQILTALPPNQENPS